MVKKKKHNLFLNILSIFFIIFMGLFIANISGYNESRIKNKTIVTENAIEEFETRVKNGEEIDITSFLKNESVDYSNKFSRLGDNLTSNIENVVVGGVNFFTNILKSLF